VPITPPVAPYGTNQELWYWNGLQLNQPYWNITTFGGSRSGIPTYRGSDYAVPYRAGQAFRPKMPDERTISLTMWTDGSGSAAGWPATDARLAFNNNWQTLRQAFYTRSGLGGSVQGQLQRNWYLTQQGSPQLVTSTAMAEIAGSMDLTMSGRTGAAFTVDLLLNDPYFYGAQRTQSISGSGSITALGEGIVGEGWSSAVSTFTVSVSAACTVTNTTAGVSFTIAGAGSYPITADVLNYTVTDSSGNNKSAALTHAGGRMWMALVPGTNNITVSSGTATFTWTDCYI
jgi:hypothetical protein